MSIFIILGYFITRLIIRAAARAHFGLYTLARGSATATNHMRNGDGLKTKPTPCTGPDVRSLREHQNRFEPIVIITSSH